MCMNTLSQNSLLDIKKNKKQSCANLLVESIKSIMVIKQYRFGDYYLESTDPGD